MTEKKQTTMRQETRMVYITKYALTTGVYTIEVEGTNTPGMVKTPRGSGGGIQFFNKPDWHDSEIGARARVVAMILAKRASLRKALAKLENYEFSVKPEAH